MARPSKNAKGPTATQRMEMAFWECMQIMPFSEITVRDIVERASVNRNSYYYHYESMWDLAQESVQHAHLAELAHALLGEEAQAPNEEAAQPKETADAPSKVEAAYDHLRILASENGSQRLLDDAKKIISDEWMTMYKLVPESSSTNIRHAIDFTFGGITALLAGAEFANLSDYKKTIEDSDVLLDTIDVLKSELDPSIDRQNRWLHRSSLKKTEETIIVEQVVEEQIVSDSVVDEIMADVKSSQVNRVLAPQPVSAEKPVFIIQGKNEADSRISEEIATKIEEKSEIENIEQVPADDSLEAPAPTPLEENAIADEGPSEAATIVHEETDEQEDLTEQSEKDAVDNEEDRTQQAMEEDHEEHTEQEPVSEPEIQEDFAPVEAIGVVSALESLQEIDKDEDDEQEPVKRYDASAPSRRNVEQNIAGFAETPLDDEENATSSYSPSDEEDEISTGMESGLVADLDLILVDEVEDDDEDDTQLSMDFLF